MSVLAGWKSCHFISPLCWLSVVKKIGYCLLSREPNRMNGHYAEPTPAPPATPASGLILDPRYKWYLVAMLWWISFFNYADRQAIFSVFDLLRNEMHLSQVELGWLGSSFAWVYGLSAPLAGLMVDRVRRKSAILGGLQVWSLICLATASARSF